MKQYILLSLALLTSFVGLQASMGRTDMPTRIGTVTNQPTKLTRVRKPVNLKPVQLGQPTQPVTLGPVQVQDLNAVKNDLNRFVAQVIASNDPLHKLQEISEVSTNPFIREYFKELSEAYKALQLRDPREAALKLHESLTALQEKAETASTETRHAVQNLQSVTQQALVSKAGDLQAQAAGLSANGFFDEAEKLAERGKGLIDAFTKMAQPACQHIINAIEIYNKLQTTAATPLRAPSSK